MKMTATARLSFQSLSEWLVPSESLRVKASIRCPIDRGAVGRRSEQHAHHEPRGTGCRHRAVSKRVLPKKRRIDKNLATLNCVICGAYATNIALPTGKYDLPLSSKPRIF